MNSAAARFEVLPGGRAEKPAEGDTSWLDAEPTETDNSPTSPWNPEHQLVGSLMWLPSDTVRRIAAVVPAAAIERPTTRWAYELITALAENGQKPDPVVVLATAKHQPCSIAADPSLPPTAHRHHQLSVYLARAYTETVCADNAGSYAREVLEDAYRRTFIAAGQRMQAIGESDSDRAELTEHFARVREELLDWWRRAETAAQPGWADR